jgi:hypothetical protein
MSEENNNTNEVEAVSTDTPVDQERTPRGTESREATQHTQDWENVSNLPTPNPQEGWVFRN